ncbi:hypothetical protein BC777_3073 [Yoonia maricola]|uniref:Uncharacterized protein n=1 Tax=Yoonia maricola TaxID=420999 RepID=A0A2M8W2D0_9RHOB|nr:hypothetical protein [Yoonia maricola]PJI85077.1 hypothetical protein BC777_3073 [Yoonia maricola]
MIRILAIVAFLLPAYAHAQETEPHMTLPRMAEIVLALDPEAQLSGAGFSLTIDDIPVLIVTDVRANRMRAMVPIRSAETMTADEMRRVMQANFDSALDARYAVARGQLWGVFLHPFKELERNQFISGVAQTVNVAKTYGSLYSSGAGQFGTGDSGDLQRELIERLLEQGEEI